MESRVNEPISDIKLLDVELLGKPIHIIREKLESLISESCSGLTNELQNWLSTNKIEANLVAVELHRFSPTSLDKDQTSTYQHQDGGMVYIHGDAQALIKLADRFYGAATERTSTSLTASDLRFKSASAESSSTGLRRKKCGKPASTRHHEESDCMLSFLSRLKISKVLFTSSSIAP